MGSLIQVEANTAFRIRFQARSNDVAFVVELNIAQALELLDCIQNDTGAQATFGFATFKRVGSRLNVSSPGFSRWFGDDEMQRLFRDLSDILDR